MTNLVQFPGLGLSFQLNRVAFTIGGGSLYWDGVGVEWERTTPDTQPRPKTVCLFFF